MVELVVEASPKQRLLTTPGEIEAILENLLVHSRCVWGIPLWHWRLVWILGFGFALTFVDMFLFVYVLPIMRLTFGFTLFEKSLLAATVFIGSLPGAFLMGSLGDRYGRKPMLFVSFVLEFIAFLLLAIAPSFYVVFISRFISGVGISGVMPIASSLLQECSPGLTRGRISVLFDSFTCVGLFTAVLFSRYVALTIGWRMSFFIGAACSVYLLIFWHYVPESPKWLVLNKQYAKALAVIEEIQAYCPVSTSMDATIGGGSEICTGNTASGEPTSRTNAMTPDATTFQQFNGSIQVLNVRNAGTTHTKSQELSFCYSLHALFRGPFLSRTLVIWFAWSGLTISYYGVFSYMPQLIVAKGVHFDQSLENTLLISAFELPGCLLSAWLVEVYGRKWTLIVSCFLSASCAVSFGYAPPKISWILIYACGFGFFNVCAWGAICAYAPENYPTWIRNFATAAPVGFSRLFAIAGVFTIPYMIESWKLSPPIIMWILGGILFVVTAVVYLYGIETKGKNIEDWTYAEYHG